MKTVMKAIWNVTRRAGDVRAGLRSVAGGCAVALGVAAALAAPSAAHGQINYQVDNRVSGLDGRRLDRNYQVGGPGVNLPVPWAFDGGFRANAIVTGNVTGLAGFHGSTVPGANQFRDFLPSSALSGFQARSVGVNDIRSYQSPPPTYFYDPRTTVADAGVIARGLNVPGTSTVISPHIPPNMVNTFDRTEVDQLLRIDPQQLDQVLEPMSIPSDLGLRQTEASTLQTGVLPSLAPQLLPGVYDAAATSSIFGAPPTASLNGPTAMLPDRPTPFVPDAPIDPDPLRPASDMPVAPFEDAPSLVPPEDRQTMANEQLQAARLSREPFSDANELGVTYLMPREHAAGAISAEGSGAAGTERDVYESLVQAFLLMQDAGTKPVGFAADGSAAPGELDAARPDVAQPPESTEGTPDGAPSQTAVAAKWANSTLEEPLDTFAGRYENQFNQLMSKAELALKEGKFYVAAQLYGLATSIDSRNPLPLLGRGHAYIATGDYLSAFESIRQGIQQFPQIAAFRLDLPAMVGQSDIFDLRRSDLEKRLADGDFYKLRFLLGYLEIYSGLVEDGILNLERAAAQAPPGDIVARFPDLLLGRQELPSVRSEGQP